MYSKLLNTGIHNDLDLYQKREVKILNLFGLIILIGLTLGSTNIYFINENYPAIFELLIAIMACFIFIFNWKRKYDLSAYTFITVLNLSIFFINQYYHESTASYLFYFPAIFCVALLHNPNGSVLRTISFLSITSIGFLLSRLLSVEFLKRHEFTAEENHLLYLYNVYFSAGITIVLVYLIIKLVNKQYNEFDSLLLKNNIAQKTISNSLKEKEIMLAEIQHRVKNNLSVIIALLNFQNENSTNKETKNALHEAKNRVMSISMVHTQLYRKDDLTNIDLRKYLSELVEELLRVHPPYSSIPVKNEMQTIRLGITKTVPLGLIVNEIITNSFKHGFKNKSNPELSLKLEAKNNYIHLTIADNGIGFPLQRESNTQSLGLNLIESLTDQIDGKVAFSNRNGAQVEISFPIS